jgi:hypothetical protein
METRIVHCRKERFDVLIDRRTVFGNLFVMNREADRDRVCDEYKKWLWQRFKSEPEFAAAILALKGKTLACWCAPKRCHGHEIVKLINFVQEKAN